MLRKIYSFFFIVLAAVVIAAAVVPSAVLAEGISAGPVTAATSIFVPKGTWVWKAVEFPEAVSSGTWSLSDPRTAGNKEWRYTGITYASCQWRTWSWRYGYQWHTATGYQVSRGCSLRVTLRKP